MTDLPRSNAGADEGGAVEGKQRTPLSTGFKLFLILSLALLPLALVALFATLQSTRSADRERQAEMRVAATESVRQLNAAFASDMALMRNAMAVIDQPGECDRLATVFASQGPAMPRFALYAVGSVPVCAAPGFAPTRPGTIGLGDDAPRTEIDENGVRLTLISASGAQAARLDYPPRVLGAIGAPGGFVLPFTLTMTDGATALGIVDRRSDMVSMAGYHAVDEALGRGNLTVELRAARDTFTAPELIALLLPIVMWAAASAIAWLVVDRVLIRPLRRLESEVSAFQPGQVIAPRAQARPAAYEIEQLGESFSALSRTVAAHEAQLAEGLLRQTKLTREVHHRVKNNLQVVASLISLHARGQKSDEVIRAYSSIQRRVDALAVVLRHHYAELEVNCGVSLRALIGELAQNFRGTQPEGEPTPTITLDLCACYSHQDIAVPIAFLLTELIELSTIRAPGASIAIALTEAGDTHALLSVGSSGLEGEDVPERFARVLEGLSRQLRAKLDKEPASGRMSITVPVEIERHQRLAAE